MKDKLTMNLRIFSDADKDFFTSAFESAYNIGEEDNNTTSEDVGDTQNVSNSEPDQKVDEVKEPSQIEDKELSPEQIKELYEKHFGKQEEKEPELDEQTKSAIELFKYLEQNPHLVQAMRDVDVEGYNQLNNYVPDELTKKVQEMEEYIQEQRYNAYISELKDKFSSNIKLIRTSTKENIGLDQFEEVVKNMFFCVDLLKYFPPKNYL